MSEEAAVPSGSKTESSSPIDRKCEPSSPQSEDCEVSNLENEYDVVLVGESGVGKTSLARCMAYGSSHQEVPSSEGMACWARKVITDKNNCFVIYFWDFPSVSSPRDVPPSFFHLAKAVLVLYDVTNRMSFAKLHEWHWVARKHSAGGTPIFTISTKCDLQSRSAMSSKEISIFVTMANTQWQETSALTGDGVNELFASLVKVFENIETEKQRKEKLERKEESEREREGESSEWVDTRSSPILMEGTPRSLRDSRPAPHPRTHPLNLPHVRPRIDRQIRPLPNVRLPVELDESDDDEEVSSVPWYFRALDFCC